MAHEDVFSLVTRPWMAVLDGHGRSREVSLREAFEEATSLRTLSGELATQDAALLRVLVAVLQRALEPEAPEKSDGVPEKLEELDAEWDSLVVPHVLDYLERHRERFDLFHPLTPFFQVPGMRTAKGEVSSLNKLILDMPAGKPFLTSRSTRAARRISAAEAARWLVHLQAYDPSGIKTGIVGHPRAKNGKVYPEGTGWTGQLGLVHLLGENLKRTLLLNLWAAFLPDDERARDLPPWERAPATLEMAPDLLERPAGPVDLYTWQPRRVLLHGGPDGVTGVLLTYGDRFIVQERQSVIHREPMSLWRYSKPQTAKYKHPIQMPSKHRPGVALWRGLAAVVPRDAMGDEKSAAPTALVQHAERLVGTDLLPDRQIHYRAVSAVYGSQESVIDEIVEDSLDLPAAVLDPRHVRLRQVALEGVQAASQGTTALAGLARGLARASGASREEADGPGERAYETGWAALDQAYRRWLVGTLAASVEEPLVAEEEWHKVAWWILNDLGEAMVASAPDKAWVGYAPATGKRADVGTMFGIFRRNLARAFPRSRPEQPVEPEHAEPDGASRAVPDTTNEEGS